MHDFGSFLRLGMMVFMVFRVKQSIWKCFRSMELDLEIFGLRLKNGLWKVKQKQECGMS